MCNVDNTLLLFNRIFSKLETIKKGCSLPDFVIFYHCSIIFSCTFTCSCGVLLIVTNKQTIKQTKTTYFSAKITLN